MSNEHRKEVTISQQELAIQLDFIKKIRDINDKQFEKTGKKKKGCIQTFGCQMNAHDSEKLIGMLVEMGYDYTTDEDESDIVVYNTCCVRENAENKVYGKIGYLKHLKEANKDFKIVLCGCMMQQNAVIDKIRKTYKQVDIIFGTHNLYRFPELLYSNMETGDMIVDVWEAHKEIIEDLPSIREFPYKASVNIMYGCNNFCTYCIVPYVRGRERSRKPEDILREVETLAKDGVKEIILLGQNVNSYGVGLSDKMSFAELLHLVNKVEGIERIRFMTSHPKDISLDLIEAIRDLDKVCNYIHLPFQSGSSRILQRMNRKYTKEKYLETMDIIRREIPNVGLTTDIIIGFPGETEEDFQETLDIVRHVRFNGAFTFLYSKRSGTPAAEMDDQVDEAVANERFQRLLKVVNPIVFEKNKELEGIVVKVLPETVNTREVNKGKTVLTGRTDSNLLVHFEGSEELMGKIVDVRIIEAKPFYLMGELI